MYKVILWPVVPRVRPDENKSVSIRHVLVVRKNLPTCQIRILIHIPMLPNIPRRLHPLRVTRHT